MKIGETNNQMVCPLRWLGSKTGHSFAGRIRNLKVYNRALAPREIRRAAGLGGNAAASLATDRPATASASDTDHDFVPENATDGDDGTRWCSGDTRDPQWLAVDLGTEQRVGRVAIKWENAFPRAYSIELSTDGQAWKTVFSGAGKPGETTVAEFAAAPARHVRIRMSDAATQWGYSVWSLDVYPPRK